MNIVYLDWPCFGQVDVLFTLEHTMKHSVTRFFHKDYTERSSEDFLHEFDLLCEKTNFDCCFSYNFFPLMAEACHRHNIKYISIVYDSPFVKLYSYTITYPTNYVFLFDSQLYLELKRGGISTVYYTVLPVNATIIDTLLTKDYNRERTTCDISFVGALYNEEHNLFDPLYQKLDDYSKGYLDSIMEAQMKVSGLNFIEQVLTPELIAKMHDAEPYEPYPDGAETLSNVYATYYIDRKLTSMERIRLLTRVSAKHPLKLFTLDKHCSIPGAVNMGITDYYAEMPLVFHDSKINLNITLRSIQSGIPLRCMDIMGAGGFLLTNFQADLLDFFIPDEDFVYYEDEDDLIRKIDYYLEHDEKRQQIAQNGHAKVLKNHSFEKCLSGIFSIAFS